MRETHRAPHDLKGRGVDRRVFRLAEWYAIGANAGINQGARLGFTLRMEYNEMIEESRLRRGAGIALVLVMIGAAAGLTSCGPKPHTVGSVNTEFKLIGPDHKIVIESYDDPKVDGVTVFISKSQKGGIKGALGLAEDMSYASVAVRQTGPIKVKQAFENGERRLHRTTLVAIQATAREPL